VDERVDAPERQPGPVDDRAARVGGAQVGGQEVRLAAGRQCGRGLLQRRRGEVGERQPRARLREGDGDGAADRAARTGDEHATTGDAVAERRPRRRPGGRRATHAVAASLCAR